MQKENQWILPDDKEAVALGLRGIPTHGLRRLIKWIEAGKPLLMDGAIVEGELC